VVRKKAAAGEVVAKRDLAILLFFLTTGRRRNEVIGLSGGTSSGAKGCSSSAVKLKAETTSSAKCGTGRCGRRSSITLKRVAG
jgi:hypothetical protein